MFASFKDLSLGFPLAFAFDFALGRSCGRGGGALNAARPPVEEALGDGGTRPALSGPESENLRENRQR